MSDYVTNYSLYLYRDGKLKLYNGERPRMKFTTIGAAIVYVRNRITKLESRVNPKVYESYLKEQILVVEYTDPWESRIRGVLTDGGKCYTELPLPSNSEVLQTRMV